MKTVAASGYFDPLHAGHIDYLTRARSLGQRLVVIVNNDAQAKLKKGQPTIPDRDRLRIVDALGCVDEVFLSIDTDATVCKSLEALGPDIFAKGGDRWRGEIPEMEVCRRGGIRVVDGLGGKIDSSSRINAVLSRREGAASVAVVSAQDRVIVPKPWGREDWVYNSRLYCGKKLVLKPGDGTSWHYHKIKHETMLLIEGQVLLRYGDADDEWLGDEVLMAPDDSVTIPPGVRHRIQAVEHSLLIEFSTEHFDSDSYRIDGRAPCPRRAPCAREKARCSLSRSSP